jgi:ABC-type Fe3+-hydroxamate transport system substrate-binding protein
VIRRVFDDRGRELMFSGPPKRVVSLVPSDTFTVAVLGCAGSLVGRTDYCELPREVVSNVPSVGGTKNPRLDAIFRLEPDLVLANQEENTRADLEAIVRKGIRVLVAFPKRVADGIAHMARLARVLDVENDAAVRALCKRGYETVHRAEAGRAARRAVRTFCPIWMTPLMTIHARTFISDMLAMAGAENVFADRERRYPLAADLGGAVPLREEQVGERDTRYPRVTMDEVNARAPELILLPDEPHPFTESEAQVFRNGSTPAALRGAIVRSDGKDLCWYGARSVDGLPRLRALIDGYRAS